MKVSVELMKWYSGEEQWQLPTSELVTKIGRQLGAVEETIDLAPKYDGAVVVRVVSCVKHANSDHLNVCKVDDGGKVEGVARDENGHVQVVCGAPNVREGILVVWLPPGANVPELYGKRPFVLEARDFRGELSNGMLASPRELAISDDHEGILELDDDIAPGTPFAQAYGLNDTIIDIENKMFTHRPDGFGNLGVARELAGIQNLPFVSPDWYSADAPLPKAATTGLPLTVKNEIPQLVPRFVAIPIDGVEVKPSPVWLQIALSKLGIRPINNIVDVTNYLMIVTGQPLHAYDYDKLAGHTIVVRKPADGEKLPLLDGRTIQPHADAMLIADAEKAIGLGGMMGGANSEISANTKRIVLEAATFDMYTIRRTSMQHGVFTDAVTRFSKGQSPLQNAAVAAKAVEEIQKYAGGVVAGEPVDLNYVDKEIVARGSVHAPITTTCDYINLRLGTQFTAEDMAVTLNNVEIAVETHGDQLTVMPPFWRTDLEIPEDIVEEIGRLRGYDQLPHELPNRTTQAAVAQPMDELKNRIRDILAAAGANELQTYTFVPQKLLEDVNQNAEHAFAIRNALSPELQRYRLSLTPSLLEKVHPNIKAGYDEFALFELNKIHIKGDQECDGLPREYQTVAFVFASKTAQPGAAYYVAKHYLTYLLDALNVPFTASPVDHDLQFEVAKQVFAPFESKRSAYVHTGDHEFTGFVGEYHARARRNLKLPDYAAGFEIDLERLLKNQQKAAYQPLLRFPATEQDVCFKVSADKTYAEVRALVTDALAGNDGLRVTISPLDIYQRSDDDAHKQITFHVSLQHAERTLTTDESNALIDAAVQHVAAIIGAERV